MSESTTLIVSHIIRKVFRDTLIESIKRLYMPNLKNEHFIRSLPRFTKHSAIINKYSISFPDAESFMSMREEIWNKESYFFETDSSSPYIIDCGSNIGLSVLYFKHIFPNSEITAFEPDPELLNYLSQNLKSNSFSDVDIIPKAVWTSNSRLPFLSDGADGGKVSNQTTDLLVDTVSLNQFLIKRVDMLKLDIEGYELEVLLSCAENLHNVCNIFIEYHSFQNKKQQLSEILKLLETSGFRYFLDSAKPRNRPFTFSSTEPMDMQVNIHAWKN
jgi:FkbM family methyltransferase